MPVYGIAQGAGSFAVYHADAGKVRQVGVVQILVQGGKRLVHGLAQQVNLRGDGKRLGHFELAGARPGGAALKRGR